MNKGFQIIINALLYGWLLWLLYDSTIIEWDPWFAACVAFVLFLAAIIWFMPGLHAPKVTPGEYPFDE